MKPKHFVVIGGSIAGLGVALALSTRGHRVTILEADATPLPGSPLDAWETWDRRGAPQARQSHALLARLRNLIRDHAPILLKELKDFGAEEISFTDRARQIFDAPEFEPGDEDIVSLACRRITFEWVLRRHVMNTGLVDFRDGAKVLRLDGNPGVEGQPPTVTGVWFEEHGKEEALLAADLVVDASGRRSQLRNWLPEIGTPEIRQESSPCGLFYTSRFYRLREGVPRPPLSGGVVGHDLGYLKLGVFAGDSRVFSITVAASPSDNEMRAVLHRPAFDAAVAAVPITAEWTSSEISEPISDVIGMANLTNTRRWFVEDGEPIALGIIPVGDSLLHTNPIVGRGCSLAWTSAFALADCVDANPNDLRALALDYEAHIIRDLIPWYDLQVTQDRDAIEVAEMQQRGEDPYAATTSDGAPNQKGTLRGLLRDGLLPGLEEDLHLLRHFMRTMNLLDHAGDLMKNPLVLQAIQTSYAKRDEREFVYRGPSRHEMIEFFEKAGVE